MNLEQTAIAMAKALGAAGGRAFYVGGAVRDRQLGLAARDIDLEVYGLAADALEPILQDFGKVHLVGQRFAVLHVATPAGEIEVSLPRTESKTGPGHKGFAIHADPALSVEDASRRRDFTLNAMLEDPLDGTLIDPWNGLADLRRGLLRHVSDAFAEDPLRVLRVGRFVSRFGFRVHPETAALCRTLDLEELPRERIEKEWRQLLGGRFPGMALLALEQCGALRYFPELAALRGVPQDPIWHPEGDVLQHTALCLNAAVARRDAMEDPWLEMLGVLCHDLGKATHTTFERGRWRSAAHDVEGEAPTRSLLERITGAADVADPVVALVKEHLRPSQLYHARDKVGDAAIRRLATRVDIPALCRVAWSDAAGRQQELEDPWPSEAWLLERAANLGVRDEAPRNYLRGSDLLDRGWSAGPQIGITMRTAFDLQLDGEIADRDAALAWLDAQTPT
ncbi:MAG: CCA tRNA nucleotidyltransferase [Planctomycetota bacterium]